MKIKTYPLSSKGWKMAKFDRKMDFVGYGFDVIGYGLLGWIITKNGIGVLYSYLGCKWISEIARWCVREGII